MNESSKFQTPNPGMKTPNTKLQTPKKLQFPSPNTPVSKRPLDLELGFSLELGVWFLVFCRMTDY